MAGSGDGRSGDTPRSRRHRRAVGPPGARRSQEPDLALHDERTAHDEPVAAPRDDDERLLREVPPHHG